MMKRSFFAASSIALIAATPALAGGYEPPVVEQPIIAPVVEKAPSTWTGFYVGGQLGYGRTSGITIPHSEEIPVPSSIPLGLPYDNLEFSKLDGGLGGIHAGYLSELGNQWVIGGELDHDWGKLSSKVDYADFQDDFEVGLDPYEAGTAELKVKRITRAKLIAGYDLGDGLIYGTAGAFRASVNGSWAGVSGTSTDTGWLVGLGYKHKFTENWVGGVEALHHKAKDFDGKDFDLKMTTITARVSFQF